MTIGASAVWRARPSGINTSGGGFDTSISIATVGSNGAATAGSNVFTDSVANGFNAGMVGAAILLFQVGQYLITSYISPSQITVNGPLPKISNTGWQISTGTDYSQQNSPQATGTNGAADLLGTSTTSNTIPAATGGSFTWTTNVAFGLSPGILVSAYDTANSANVIFGTVTSNTGTTLTMTCTNFSGSGTFTTWSFDASQGFVDTVANNFTAAMIGNAIQVNWGGGNIATYYVQAWITSAFIVLDRAAPPGGASASWSLGGAWADFWTNTTPTVGIVQNDNTVYILGSGTPNPSAYIYDYTYTGTGFWPVGSSSDCIFSIDPATPGYKYPPDTTGGMPVVKVNCTAFDSLFGQEEGYSTIQGIWFVAALSNIAAIGISGVSGNFSGVHVFGCVLDQFGFDAIMVYSAPGSTGSSSLLNLVGCECFSSQGGTGGLGAALFTNPSVSPGQNMYASVQGCNFHDCVGYGIYAACGTEFDNVSLNLLDTIIAKCSQDGLYYDTYLPLTVKNCTIDGNGGWAINIGSLINGLIIGTIINTIMSNHTSVGKGAFNIAGTSGRTSMYDYNTYYNNTVDINPTGQYGPHDTHGGSNPYRNQSIEDYTLV